MVRSLYHWDWNLKRAFTQSIILFIQLSQIIKIHRLCKKGNCCFVLLVKRLPANMAKPNSLCLIKYELDINVFVFVYIWGFSAKLTWKLILLKRSNGKIIRIKLFRVWKTNFFIRLRFQGNRSKSGIDFFAWRVT